MNGVDIFVERQYPVPFGVADVVDMAEQTGGCFRLYNIGWVESFLSVDGRQLFCHFTAPDVESIRTAFRQTGNQAQAIWGGTIHRNPKGKAANTLVARSFDQPVMLEDIQAQEDANAGCLQIRNVVFERTFFAADRKRMWCFYHAPDAEAVRQAQRLAGMPMEAVWAFQHLTPERLHAAGFL